MANKAKGAPGPAVKLTSYPGTVRQLIVTGLGREAPTVIITNDNDITAKALTGQYARRMTIEQRLAEIIQGFCADALSSAVNLNVDLCVPPGRRAPDAPARQLRQCHPRHRPPSCGGSSCPPCGCSGTLMPRKLDQPHDRGDFFKSLGMLVAGFVAERVSEVVTAAGPKLLRRAENLLVVEGAVPGHRDAYVVITKAKKPPRERRGFSGSGTVDPLKASKRAAAKKK